MKHLLKDNEIDQPNEFAIWSAVLSWLNHDLPTREQYCDALMACIRLVEEASQVYNSKHDTIIPLKRAYVMLILLRRFPLIDAASLVELRSHSLMSSEICRKLLDEAANYKLLEMSGQVANLPEYLYPILRPR